MQNQLTLLTQKVHDQNINQHGGFVSKYYETRDHLNEVSDILD